ncbi:MAG: Dabb family protein [Pseudobutyrivibrio sp.]|nr:Dabb family protein [Pseudobutyrivibrio sp.]
MMIRHIIIWKLQDKCFGPNLDSIKASMKARLEEVNGQTPGLKNLEVHGDCLRSSNGDIVLEAVFDDEEAMKNFKLSDMWKAATKEAVVPFIADATHVEYEF